MVEAPEHHLLEYGLHIVQEVCTNPAPAAHAAARDHLLFVETDAMVMSTVMATLLRRSSAQRDPVLIVFGTCHLYHTLVAEAGTDSMIRQLSSRTQVATKWIAFFDLMWPMIFSVELVTRKRLLAQSPVADKSVATFAVIGTDVAAEIGAGIAGGAFSFAAGLGCFLPPAAPVVDPIVAQPYLLLMAAWPPKLYAC